MVYTMRILCEGCGKKVNANESSCPICGYVLYKSVFDGISAEIESEMQNISEHELNKVKKEMQGSKAKMSFDEFREFAKKEAGFLPPILPKSRMMYEMLLHRAYKNYLRNFGK